MLMNHCFSIIIFTVLMAASAVSSIGSYQTAETMIVDDLNRALTLTIAEKRGEWLTPDTIRAYRRLQGAMDGRLTINTRDNTFCRHLTIPQLRSVAYVQLCMPADDGCRIAAAGLCSDTLIWRSGPSGTSVAVRSCAGCSAATVFALSDQRAPLGLCLTALLWAAAATLHRKERRNAGTAAICYGDIRLSADGNCFYDASGKMLRLTPMQHRLMLMFFRSPSHCLAKQEICDALWPRKDDANDTLYTLIRRLKPVLEASGNLRIEAERGRAYRLTIRPSD